MILRLLSQSDHFQGYSRPYLSKFKVFPGPAERPCFYVYVVAFKNNTTKHISSQPFFYSGHLYTLYSVSYISVWGSSAMHLDCLLDWGFVTLWSRDSFASLPWPCSPGGGTAFTMKVHQLTHFNKQKMQDTFRIFKNLKEQSNLTQQYHFYLRNYWTTC